MTLTLDLSPEVERQLQEQAAREGMDIKHYAETVLDNKLDLLAILAQALTTIQPPLRETAQRKIGTDLYLLSLVQAMTALSSFTGISSASESRDYQQNLLNNAIRLYSLRILPLGLAAQMADISQAEFIDALGKAGGSVFQYGAEEILSKAEAK